MRGAGSIPYSPMRYPGRVQADRWWRRPWHPRGPKFVGWRTRQTGLLLAVGSFLTFLGPGLWLSTGDSVGFFIAIPAALILVYAWVGLGEDIRAIPRGRERARRKRAMWVSYGLLWLAFVLGILTLPLALSGPLSGGTLPTTWGVLLLGPFLYIPTVFGPMALTHAVIFGLGRRFLGPGHPSRLTAVGTTILVAVAVLGLALQGLGPFPAWGFFLVGGLGFGYLAIGLATSRSAALPQTASPAKVGWGQGREG